ncbi:hypothetical protein [Rhizohabitans arisaemae]|uniref:hypothetical protein n=1 Tax=Rhizohabitans arisaemae TaxID=2720610 RepID=UPI0024B15851|nr:hypothetical protein [Rhizohabitans arisaemae]
MSKERARRRAEREEAQAVAALARAEHQAKLERWRRRRARLAEAVPRPVRVARQGGIIARRRRAQNAGMFILFVLVQILGWLLLEGWAARAGLFMLSVLLVPVLVTVLFDRRS